MAEVVPLFARQPIFNLDYEVVAYELLFRQSNLNSATILDGDMATAQVLLKVFGENQIQEVIGNHKAYVNYTRSLVCAPPPLPSKQLVVELLEGIDCDEKILDGLKNLRNAGYQIALDDFVLEDNTRPLIEHADIIKLDVLTRSTKELEAAVKALKPFNKILLAEKVENHETLEYCRNLGFTLFQGYFLCKPQIIKGVSISEGKQAILKLISVLNNPAVEFEQIIQTIATDPSLSYKILRLVNSSAIGLPRQIDSLNQAVTLLGLNAIRNWATYLLMANNSDKPRELCVISMCRAKFCEMVARSMQGKEAADAAFTVGLLYNLDAFLDLPMADLMEKLRLSDNIRNALLNKEGLLGKILNNVVCFERGDWSGIDWSFLEKNNLPASEINHIYSHSIAWATETVGTQL